MAGLAEAEATAELRMCIYKYDIRTVYTYTIYSIIIFMCWSHEMRCINLARLLFDNIFLFFSFIFVRPSSLFCACLWDFYGLIRFCAYTLVIVSLAEGVRAREPRGCQGGTARGYSEGVVSAANLLRLLLTVAMFEGHAGSAKLAKKRMKERNRQEILMVYG